MGKKKLPKMKVQRGHLIREVPDSELNRVAYKGAGFTILDSAKVKKELEKEIEEENKNLGDDEQLTLEEIKE